MTYLLSIAILTLFLPLKVNTGFVQLRPFDAMVAIMLICMIAQGTRLPRGRLSTGFLILLPYFIWHVVSACTFDAVNGLREGLQIATVMSFAYVVMAYSDKIDIAKAGTIFLYGLVAVIAFNIGWHIAHGHLTGWKRLVDPKAAFNFFPMVLGLMLVLAPKGERRTYWVWWIAFVAILIMSGERKALLIYMLTTAIIVARGRLLAFVPVLMIVYFSLVLYVSTLDQNSYVTSHLSTILNPGTTSFESAMRGATPDSLSDAQRKFTMYLSGQLFAQHPFWGIGTNRFVELIDQRYAYLPEFMKGGIHGEFQRVLTENGIFGLALYLPIWILSFLRLQKVMRWARTARLLTPAQTRALPFLLILSPVTYVATESSGTHSYVPLIIVSLAPNIAFYALARRAGAVVQGRQPGERPQSGGEIVVDAYGIQERG